MDMAIMGGIAFTVIPMIIIGVLFFSTQGNKQ